MLNLNRRTFLGAAALSPLAALAASLSNAGSGRILVVYGTRCGSTQEIAQTIRRDLSSRGYSGDIRTAGQVKTFSGYDAVVIGSAVRFGKWLPEPVELVRRHRAELNRVPAAFFSVHLMNTGADDVSKKARLAYTAPVRALVRPAAEVFFTGKMDICRLGFGERLMCKVMRANNEDKRDWNAIHAWGNSLFAGGVERSPA